MKGIIYCFKNRINSKLYIGLTINSKRRKKEFYNINNLYTSKDENLLSKIDKARRKYGVNNFEYSILEVIEEETKKELIDQLNILEDFYIDKYDTINNGYNTIRGGASYIHQEKRNNIKYNKEKINIELEPFSRIYYDELDNLDPKEILVLATLKLSKNGLFTLSELTRILSISINTVKNIIKSLIEKQFVTIVPYKNSKRFIFKDSNNKKHFEPFSYDFLDKKDLTFTEKSYIVASQQYMFKDKETNEGNISYTNKELSSLIKMPESTISRCNHSLEAKGYLNGASDMIKRFQLRELAQLVIWKFKEQDEKIQKNTDDIVLIKQKLAQLEAENEELKKQVNAKNVYTM